MGYTFWTALLCTSLEDLLSFFLSRSFVQIIKVRELVLMTGQLHQCSPPSVKVYFSGSMSFTAKLVKSPLLLEEGASWTLRLPVYAQGRAPLNSWQCGQLLSFVKELQVGSKRNHDWDLKASVCLAAMSLLEAVRKHPARAGDRFGAASREGCTNVRVPAGLPLSLKVSGL